MSMARSSGMFHGGKAHTVAMPKPTGLLEGRGSQSETFWYTAKKRMLGPPLVNEQLGEQRLSKPLALGVLSPDGISSSAYGTEEILIALLPMAGLAAFTLILPMTLVILLVMILVVLSYREIVMVYILSLIHISEPTRLGMISYAVFCLKKK